MARMSSPCTVDESACVVVDVSRADEPVNELGVVRVNSETCSQTRKNVVLDLSTISRNRSVLLMPMFVQVRQVPAAGASNERLNDNSDSVIEVDAAINVLPVECNLAVTSPPAYVQSRNLVHMAIPLNIMNIFSTLSKTQHVFVVDGNSRAIA